MYFPPSDVGGGSQIETSRMKILTYISSYTSAFSEEKQTDVLYQNFVEKLEQQYKQKANQSYGSLYARNIILDSLFTNCGFLLMILWKILEVLADSVENKRSKEEREKSSCFHQRHSNSL
jgi:hypothetical protein